MLTEISGHKKSYTLRYLGLKASGEHHRGFGEGHLNVSVFIQGHARHEYLTINDQKALWREVDTNLYLDTERMELDEDDNHHHDHNHDHDQNHRYDKERNGRYDQFDLWRDRKRRRVISSECSGNGQNNDDQAEGQHCEVERQQLGQLRLFRNRQEQALPPVQTVIGAPVYMSSLRTAQEEAVRTANDISPNLNDESSVSWTSPESNNQEIEIPAANFRTAQQLLTAQDNQEKHNQSVNIQIYKQINQLHEVNREIQIQQQDVIVNNTQSNELIQQIDVTNLEQNIQQNIENIPMNELGNINDGDYQLTQIGATHSPQK
ncbi:MAG: hypothetical protein EZS28_010013 [Streblomastix strix]|uniref:Uncharacterized protein n=1 Tax=Streblomastix strix TaxID=222440 RepID=A0A5J4WHI1_9EUKA|nr:MAG: hypothetical protein EZS28_010013 [Streblomastix strix]